VVDHPRLSQGEAGEDADGEERDQRVGVSAGGGQQDRGEQRQGPDAAVEDQPVAADGEAMGETVRCV